MIENRKRKGRTRKVGSQPFRRGKCSVDVILFDFGGVLADEGFAEGLAAIAKKSGIDEEAFVVLGHELVHETGFVTGRSDESTYWAALRRRAGIRGSDEALRDEIMKRFKLRPWMLEIAAEVRKNGTRVGILSDQTLWLDELNAKYGFFSCFDYVFNSYHMGKSKMDPSHFGDIVEALQSKPGKVLFVDDNGGHIERARRQGWKTIRYDDRNNFIRRLKKYCGFIKASV
jgi:putative hydrolase of the HAD superfamily